MEKIVPAKTNVQIISNFQNLTPQIINNSFFKQVKTRSAPTPYYSTEPKQLCSTSHWRIYERPPHPPSMRQHEKTDELWSKEVSSSWVFDDFSQSLNFHFGLNFLKVRGLSEMILEVLRHTRCSGAPPGIISDTIWNIRNFIIFTTLPWDRESSFWRSFRIDMRLSACMRFLE